MIADIAIVILAAGASTRMKKVKQLLPWGNNTLLGNAIHQAKASGAKVFVITGAYADLVEKEIDNEEVNIIYNPRWQEGIGSSISVAAAHLKLKYPEIKALIITLADQPYLDTSHYTEMISNYFSSDALVVATTYEDHPGVPALFSNLLFEDLIALEGNTGARHIINANSARLMSIPGHHKIADIDTPEMYRKLYDRTFKGTDKH